MLRSLVRINEQVVNLLGLSYLRVRKLDHRSHHVKTNLPVYITLSTIPPRLSNTIKIVVHMLKHVEGVEKIILNVPLRYQRFPNYQVDLEKHQKDIRELGPLHNRLLINRCKDYGPLTKFLPSIELVPDESILITIDDMCYKLDAIKNIAERQELELRKAFGYYVYPYAPKVEGAIDKGFEILVPQCADMLSVYARNVRSFPGWFHRFLDKSSLAVDDYIRNPCFFVDDQVLGYYLQLEGIQLEQVEANRRENSIPHCAVYPSKFNLNRQTGDNARNGVMSRCYAELMKSG